MNAKREVKSFMSEMRLPELRAFWLFLALAIILLVVDKIYLHGALFMINAASLALIGIIIFWSSLRLARSNLAEKSAAGRLERIVHNLGDGIIAYDNNFKILTFNGAAERIFGIPAKEVIGMYFGPERAGESRYRILAQTMFPSLAPTMIRRSDSGIYPQIVDISFADRELRVSTDKIEDDGGRTIGFMKIVNDRTREKELIKSKSEFITIAAHQLRTPLTAVYWTLEGLSKNKSLNDTDLTLAKNGLLAAGKLLKIVNDLLDVSKMEEGRFGYQMKEINIVDFLGDILANANAIASQYGVSLYYDKGGSTNITVTADGEKLGLAISNIIDNAIKYNVKNGTVTISIKTAPDRPYVDISIKDTGIGIPAGEMQKVFTKFFRAENVVRQETTGTGLGLYIAKNIITRHGGAIWGESVINRGTTFYISLPTDPALVPKAETSLE